MSLHCVLFSLLIFSVPILSAPLSAQSYLLDKLLDAIVQRILNGKPLEIEAHDNSLIFRQTGDCTGCNNNPLGTPSSRSPQIVEPPTARTTTAPPMTTGLSIIVVNETMTETAVSINATLPSNVTAPSTVATSRNPFWWWQTEEPTGPWWWNTTGRTTTTTAAPSTSGWFWWNKP